MIERQAITHIPLSQYAFTNSETSLTIRIRAAKGNLERCTLWFGDRVHPTDPIPFTPLPMEKIGSDLYFDFYEATFESPYTRVCYYFELADKEEQVSTLTSSPGSFPGSAANFTSTPSCAGRRSAPCRNG